MLTSIRNVKFIKCFFLKWLSINAVCVIYLITGPQKKHLNFKGGRVGRQITLIKIKLKNCIKLKL